METFRIRALPTATLLELKQELANESGVGITRKDPMVYKGLGQVGAGVHRWYVYSREHQCPLCHDIGGHMPSSSTPWQGPHGV